MDVSSPIRFLRRSGDTAPRGSSSAPANCGPTKGLTMADGRRGGAPTKGAIEESAEELKQAIEEWFDDLDYTKYDPGYREIALSAANGALEALALQQDGGSSGSGDQVDYPRFLWDAYARTVMHAWDGWRDVTMQFCDDVYRYSGWYKD